MDCNPYSKLSVSQIKPKLKQTARAGFFQNMRDVTRTNTLSSAPGGMFIPPFGRQKILRGNAKVEMTLNAKMLRRARGHQTCVPYIQATSASN